MVGSGMGAKHGILFKTAAALENAGRVQIVALDKTGTITKGEPHVTDILPAEGITEDLLLENAFCLEAKSEHPLAKAILQYGTEKSLVKKDVTDFKVLPGNGLMGCLEGRKLIDDTGQCLHAKELGFVHPRTHKFIKFDTDFSATSGCPGTA